MSVFNILRIRLMEAVIKTGGKQYRVATGSVLKVERLDVEAGQSFLINDVLMTVDNGKINVGKPVVEAASVQATLVEHIRGPKLLIFKKRRRKNSQRKAGHRQDLSVIKIEAING